MYVFDMNTMNLHIEVHDLDALSKTELMGTAMVDMTRLEFDKTHFMKIPLVDGGDGTISLFLTITGLANTMPSIEAENSTELIPYAYRDSYEISMNYVIILR